MRPEAKAWVYSAIFCIAVWIHGSFIGLTDDEAYYWVLAQKPALGYAYHPPMVAWLIAVFQVLLSKLFSSHSPALVRLPAALCVFGVLGLSLRWLLEVGLKTKDLAKAILVLVSFGGFFSLSWMMVPDLPLFLGWSVLFYFTWKICFKKSSVVDLSFLGAGCVLLLLSKYSGVLAVFSSALALILFPPPKNRNQALATLAVASGVAALPTLIWNAQHEWVSLLYQVRDRHQGGGASVIRWIRFFAVEIALAGPLGIFFIVPLLKRAKQRVAKFLLVWIIPAGIIFCVQPLFSDFKPHWAFIVWWPVFLGIAHYLSQDWKWIRIQIGYGLAIVGFIWVSCHVPIVSRVMLAFSPLLFKPTWDVTNDFYGWNLLPDRIQGSKNIPVVGSRYQTAAQAAFAFGSDRVVSLIPQGIRDQDEWPKLDVAESLGPDWPKLTQPVWFVADNRYSAPPEFKDASCVLADEIQFKRQEILAKRISIFRCIPN